MESIAPPLSCILTIKQALLNGKSLEAGLQNYIDSEHDSFKYEIQKLLYSYQSEDPRIDTNLSLSSQYRMALLHLILQGLKGYPILEKLELLEIEVQKACSDEVEACLQALPIKMLIPTLFLMLPAYLTLLLYPLIVQIIGGV